jgi:hypothetical protein
MTVRTSRGHGSQPRSFPGQTGRTCNSWRGDWLRLQRRELHGRRDRPTTRRASQPARLRGMGRRAYGDRKRARTLLEALPEALALVLHPTRLLRDFSRHCAGRPDAEFAKLLRTFGCRHRHMSIGDFSAQCLNGRRQAMIFRLSGVALFRGSVRRVPAERKRQERPRQMIVVGRLRRFRDGCLDCLDARRRRHRAHRQAQTSTLHIHCGAPVSKSFEK